jgi:mannan endo-1,4-beta-mannosidase
MKSSIKTSLLIVFCVGFIACKSAKEIQPIDKKATVQTKALLRNLDKLRQEKVLFGHQDDLAYGVNWWDEPGKSDVKEVTGAYPAVFGWEIGHIELGKTESLDNVSFDKMRNWIREAYEMAGVNTISWHLDNPVNGKSAWDKTETIKHILPGGSHHDVFLTYLDRLADFLGSLKDKNGQPIPIVFRPWHEHTGSWFWWSLAYTDGDEYVQLWRFTVEYLRDTKNLHHLLYAYAGSNTNYKDMWPAYPGNDYVDIIGFDDYFQAKTGEDRENDIKGLTERLVILVNEAEKNGKVPAFTECGQEALVDRTWYSEFLLKAIQANPVSKRIAYVLTWRNANMDRDRKNHFYAPYPGHESAADFILFKNSSMILFSDELPQMYK